VAAARAAYLSGFASTSNLMAGHRYGVPTAGTAAHAFTLLHDSEKQAFQAQIDSLGESTTLLVDTYDVAEAVRTGVELAGPDLGAVRLDSGDLAEVAHAVRAQLDALGADKTRILVTSDLDEYTIAALSAAPVDAYGVGTSLVTGSGVPTAALVYKLVAREDSDGIMQPVAKRSVGKPSRGGRKEAFRQLDPAGTAVTELVTVSGERPENARPLQAELLRDGEIVGREGLDAARLRHHQTVAELPAEAHQLSRGYAAIPTVFD
jgi:nicotinate phosphoribosyltransferase